MGCNQGVSMIPRDTSSVVAIPYELTKSVSLHCGLAFTIPRFAGLRLSRVSVQATKYEPTSDAAAKIATKHTRLTVVPLSPNAGINPPYISSRRMWAEILRSIHQSVQDGQFLSSLAQNAPHLLVASHGLQISVPAVLCLLPRLRTFRRMKLCWRSDCGHRSDHIFGPGPKVKV